MKAQRAAGAIPRQRLLVPLTFDVSESDAQQVEDLAQQLKESGLFIERLGSNSVVVREVPVLLAKADLEQMVTDLLAEMAEYGTADGLNRHGLDLQRVRNGGIGIAHKISRRIRLTRIPYVHQ